MTLSKQLFAIITFIFIMIFVGNFVITVNNTKEYLEQESTTKAKDTAVSIGMILKGLISNKKDPEIQSTIKIISDSGFYSSIVLEDLYFTFTDKELILNNSKLEGLDWEINNVQTDKNLGEISINNDEDLENELNELNELENLNDDQEILNKDENEIIDRTYTFIPKNKIEENTLLKLKYTASKNSEKFETVSEIKLSKILVSTKRKIKFDDVPQWFVDMINIKIPTMSSQINDGWKATAIIYVSPNPGIAYKKLYEQVIAAFYYSLFAFVIAIVMLYMFLFLILKPLRNIENLAKKITEGDFSQITEIPWTLELKTVSIAMNNMSHKIETIITRLNKNIQNISEKLSVDSLTKLPLKQEFETDLKKIFMKKESGFIYFLRISNLTDYAQSNGARDVDNFIISVSNIISNFKQGKAYRFFGSEFMIIFNGISDKQNEEIKEAIYIKLEELSNTMKIPNIANIGIVPFDQYDTNSVILSNANEAYEMAKQVGPNMSFFKSKDKKSMGAMKWRELTKDIINNDKISLEFKGHIENNKKKNIQEAFTKVTDMENNILPIGTFLSVAQENHLAIKFDKLVINRVLKHIKDNDIKHNIIINLSFESIEDIEFLDYLKDILTYNKNISKYIVFALTAYSVSNNINRIQKFAQFIKDNNSNFMIKRYEIKFVTIENIKLIKPTSIRLSREYTSDVNNDTNKKALLDAISNVSEIIDIEIYSEDITSKKDYDFLCKIGINVCVV